MKHTLHLILWWIFVFGIFSQIETLYAGPTDINMGVSPIRDEFTAKRGETIERTIKFYNNSNTAYRIFMSAEDCSPGDNNWTPLCSPHIGSWINIDKSSTWIQVQSGTFNVPAKWEKIITYKVNVPQGATPGGHYGAVFFNNQDIAKGWSSIAMNRRIGMLYLMNVAGDIVVDTKFGDILIDSDNLGIDDVDFFSAPTEYIKKKFQMIFSDPEWASKEILQEINPVWEKPVLTQTGFVLTLKIPVKNDGNIHIKPTGKIFIYDGDTLLTRIGKQTIIDENGVYLGEKVVDFLPVNDDGGNVLPDTERIFSANWFGFASMDFDQNGKQVIKFESPSDYYSRIAQDGGQFIYPWEKLAIRKTQKTLTAKVEITYRNPKTGKDEIRTLDIPVNIKYVQIARVINWSLIIIIVLILFIVYIFIRGKKQWEHVHDLEDEVHHLEDEIAVLERAKKNPPTKKIKSSEVKKAVIKTASKTPATKKKWTTTEVKVEEKSKPIRKPRTKKIDTSTNE
jgi:hypothetical protein